MSGSNTILKTPDTKNAVHYLISKPLKQRAFKYDEIPSNLVVKANKASKEKFRKMEQLRALENTDDLSGGNVTLYKEFRATVSNNRHVSNKNSSMDNTQFVDFEDNSKNIKKHNIDVVADGSYAV